MSPQLRTELLSPQLRTELLSPQLRTELLSPQLRTELLSPQLRTELLSPQLHTCAYGCVQFYIRRATWFYLVYLVFNTYQNNNMVYTAGLIHFPFPASLATFPHYLPPLPSPTTFPSYSLPPAPLSAVCTLGNAGHEIA